MAPVDEELARARQNATRQQSWTIKIPHGFSIAVIVACAVAALAQGPTKPTVPTTPALSTAEKTALTALEKQKQEAQQNFQQAQQAESVIEREFITAHAGFHVNPMTFVVEADAPIGHVDAPAPKPVLQRPAPPKK